jgi:hypothetical protein
LRSPNEVSRDTTIVFKALWHLNILNVIRKLLLLHLLLSSNIHMVPQRWYRYEIPYMALHLTAIVQIHIVPRKHRAKR